VAAYALAHGLVGVPLPGFDASAGATVVAVSLETDAPVEDIRIEFSVVCRARGVDLAQQQNAQVFGAPSWFAAGATRLLFATRDQMMQRIEATMEVFVLTDQGPTWIEQLQTSLPSDVRVSGDASFEPSIAEAARFHAVVADFIPESWLRAAGRLTDVVIPFAGVPRSTREVLTRFPDLAVHNSHYNAAATAEHAWALLLAAAKRIVPCDQKLRRGDWSPRTDGTESVGLEGKTLLVVGWGAVGRRIGRIGAAFHMRVFGVRRRPEAEASRRDLPDEAGGFASAGPERIEGPSDLPSLLPQADVIVLAVPDTSETERLLNGEAFARMKTGVIVVNIARGAAIDEEAFYNAILSNRVGAAGIDAWWVYPESPESTPATRPSRFPFGELGQVVLSPHRAAHSERQEADRRADLAVILRNIRSGTPVSKVDREVWY
jgi:phosphoglycerate dehydrogenase-like enzyme